MKDIMERMIIAERYEKNGLEGCIKELVPSEKEALKIHKKEMKEKDRKVNKLGFKATYIASVLRIIVGVLAYKTCCEDKEKVLEAVEKIEELAKELREYVEEV